MNAVVDWRWLYAKTNGVLTLQALDSDGVVPKQTLTPTDLPVVIRCIVLVSELTVVTGGAFMLLLTSSVIGVVVRSLLHVSLAATTKDVLLENTFIQQICETVAYAWGLGAFMSCFVRRSKRDLARRLTGFGWGGYRTCCVSLTLHFVTTVVLVLLQQQTTSPALVSWTNVTTALYRPDGSFAATAIIQKLLLAPMKEELFFRGAVVLVTINRLQSAKWSAVISAALFAAVHLANARHVGAQYSASYVAFQVLWASLVGLFLALELAVSGSVVVCFVLHVINNTFALTMSTTDDVILTQPLVAFSVIAALVIYFVAIANQLRRLRSVELQKQL
ncbi:unnamed protein product [Hyaloperonospora brassicae]|uniref:CAAX prenyl protease 2/Lysostaphin resistance protein A-like domain-containing protein n=1 Tax=Hyaloperonospora brassicae TaxID=162125 RepID=A0AAV0V5T2_HYABA|nr:unnamed protein product [Hyaloperonospora brassicae]